MKHFITASVILVSGLCMSSAFAADGYAEKTGEAIQEGAQDTAKHAKKAARSVKHGACKIVKGKEECVGMGAKHAMKNTADEVSDKADDVKKKVD